VRCSMARQERLLVLIDSFRFEATAAPSRPPGPTGIQVSSVLAGNGMALEIHRRTRLGRDSLYSIAACKSSGRISAR